MSLGLISKESVQTARDAFNAAKAVYENMVSNLGLGTSLEPGDDLKAVSGTQVASYTIQVEKQPDFASISASTEKRLITVDQDETNANQPTTYYHDGNGLFWLPMVRI